MTDWATLRHRGIQWESDVYEAKTSSRGFILSMDETKRHLCILFRFCVQFFKCQDCWQAPKDLQCAAHKILMRNPPMKAKKTRVNLSLIPGVRAFA